MILCVSSDSLCMCIRMNMIIMICSSDSSAKIRVANFSKNQLSANINAAENIQSLSAKISAANVNVAFIDTFR